MDPRKASMEEHTEPWAINEAVTTAELHEWGAGEDKKCGPSFIVCDITPCAWSVLVCAITSAPGSSALVCANPTFA